MLPLENGIYGFNFFFFLSACSDYGILPEEMELAKQMNALGLPLSFNTNKKVGFTSIMLCTHEWRICSGHRQIVPNSHTIWGISTLSVTT